MRPLVRELRSTLAAALAAALAAGALVSALSTQACAPPGRRYDNCPSDGAPCGTSTDGGAIDLSHLLTAPVTVLHDGSHNSGTDALYFQGAAWLVFRSAPAWSVVAGAKLVVLRSLDHGATWTQTAALALKDRDLRQPKLAVFEDRLEVVATAWDPKSPEAHHTVVVGASSADGVNFTDLATLGLPDGSAAWRPRLLLGQLWLSGWKADEVFPSSAGGPISLFGRGVGSAAFVAQITPLPLGGGARQAELLLLASGQLWAAVPERAVTGTGDQTSFCSAALAAAPKWSCWSVSGLLVEAPALIEYQGVLLLAGRHDAGGGKRRTAIWQVMEGDRDARLVADLPGSQGETGAPAWLPLDGGKARLTYFATSPQDPHLPAADPTEVQAQSLGLSTDVFAVTVDLAAAVSQ